MKLLFGADECYKLYLSDNFDDRNKDLEVVRFTFPGGEPHVKIAGIDGGDFPEDFHNLPIRIYHTIKSFNDLGTLYMTIDALRATNCWKISLFLPYFPGARQDRRAADVCEPLSVKVYADLINALKLDEVIIFDPHSEVAPALINNCVVLSNHLFAQEAAIDDFSVYVAPDAGAVKKLEPYVYSPDIDWETNDDGLPDIVYCRKHRDMKTGELSGFTMDKIDLKGSPCTVIDDICDGGRTFIEVAKLLKENNAGDLHLVVSHGIFSNGTEQLLSYFKTITTSNSWADHGVPGVNVIDIAELYNL